MWPLYKIPLLGTDWSGSEYSTIMTHALRRGSRTSARTALAEQVRTTFNVQPSLVNSGRSALTLALEQIRTNSPAERQEVLVPSLICPCVPSRVVREGFSPVFYDVKENVTASPEMATEGINHRTAAVVYAHLYGKTADIPALAERCRENGTILIEDCASTFLLQAPSGKLTGTAGDYAIFSFATGKTIAAGAGGILLDRKAVDPINSPSISRDPGIARTLMAKSYFVSRYVWGWPDSVIDKTCISAFQPMLGQLVNETLPMSEIDAGIILNLIERWPRKFLKKQGVINRYLDNFSDIPQLRLPQYEGDFVGRIFVEFPQPVVRWNGPDAFESPLIDFLKGKGIQTSPCYFPAHERPEFSKYACQDLANTRHFCSRLIEVPSQTTLTSDQVDEVCGRLEASIAVFASDN
jgi:dTDP-4-amino-4,6-dideoxygalactose transaminase